MKFINVGCDEFIERDAKSFIQFGASSAWTYYFSVAPKVAEYVLEHTLFIVDNDPNKQGEKFIINGKEYEVKSIEAIREERNCAIVIAASMAYQESICEQLLRLGLPKEVECYSLPLMFYTRKEDDHSIVDEYFSGHTQRVNVPRIHSFWFSGEEKPDLYKRCIESWHKYCPGFEIIEWTSDNYDVTKNSYMLEAYERRKWAFVSDYARLDVVYQYGGIYMDMDVELVRPIDQLLNAESFFCKQGDGSIELGSGFGACRGDSLIAEMLATYQKRRFVMENGELDITPQPEWVMPVLEKGGILRGNNSQVIGNRLILSNDYIQCGVGEDLLQKTIYGVHWHNGGWLDEKNKRMFKESLWAKNRLQEKYFKG